MGTEDKSLLLPIEITAERNVNGTRMDVNVLSSAYEKMVRELVREAIAQENVGQIGVYYVTKEAETLTGDGVQFPKQLSSASASVGSVHKIPENVNMKILDPTQSLQFTRWFGDWQNDPKRASQVVNEDGTLKVVYHGTGADFSVFQSEEGTYWFSKDVDYAEKKARERGGTRVVQAYLDMKDPYYAQLEPGKFTDPAGRQDLHHRSQSRRQHPPAAHNRREGGGGKTKRKETIRHKTGWRANKDRRGDTGRVATLL